MCQPRVEAAVPRVDDREGHEGVPHRRQAQQEQQAAGPRDDREAEGDPADREGPDENEGVHSGEVQQQDPEAAGEAGGGLHGGERGEGGGEHGARAAGGSRYEALFSEPGSY